MNLLNAFIARRLVTRPAIWGKLPAQADFVRQGVRDGESADWQAWLAAQSRANAELQPNAPPDTTASRLPVAFVLSPGTLRFAPRRHVLGVLLPSRDRVGREHPLIVYQQAHPRWLKAQVPADAEGTWPPELWLFRLSRLLARQANAQARLDTLAPLILRLWQVHAPALHAAIHPARLGPKAAPAGPSRAADTGFTPDADDPAGQLLGVRFMPWVDWPHRLLHAPGRSAFWQCDAHGGIVDAAEHLNQLQRVSTWT